MFLTMAIALGAGLLLKPQRVLASLPSRARADDEQRFLAAVHGELRAGASLRWALAEAAGSHSGAVLKDTRRLALAGAPMDRVARSLRRLPENGRGIAAAVQVSAVSGGKAADMFLSLANRSAQHADLDRQRRILTAQARFSALVVGGLPILWLAFGGVGRLRSLVDRGAGLIALVGIALESAGALLVWRLAAR